MNDKLIKKLNSLELNQETKEQVFVNMEVYKDVINKVINIYNTKDIGAFGSKYRTLKHTLIKPITVNDRLKKLPIIKILGNKWNTRGVAINVDFDQTVLYKSGFVNSINRASSRKDFLQFLNYVLATTLLSCVDALLMGRKDLSLEEVFELIPSGYRDVLANGYFDAQNVILTNTIEDTVAIYEAILFDFFDVLESKTIEERERIISKNLSFKVELSLFSKRVLVENYLNKSYDRNKEDFHSYFGETKEDRGDEFVVYVANNLDLNSVKQNCEDLGLFEAYDNLQLQPIEDLTILTGEDSIITQENLNTQAQEIVINDGDFSILLNEIAMLML